MAQFSQFILVTVMEIIRKLGSSAGKTKKIEAPTKWRVSYKKRAIGVGGAVPHQDFQEGSVFFLKQAIPF